MKRRNLIILTAASCATNSSAQSVASSAPAVQAAIRDYYEAWENRDEARYRALVTEDYMLLEHGERMTLDDDVKMMPKSGSKRSDAFDFRAVRILGEVAYAHWFLESQITDEKGVRHRRWLESGVLRLSAGTWKVALLHSTRIEQTK